MLPFLKHLIPYRNLRGSSAEIFGIEVWGNDYSNRHPVMLLHRFFRTFSDGFYWLRYRLHPNHQYHIVRTGLEPGYHDTDGRLLNACMALLGEFIEREHGGEAQMEEYVQWCRDDDDVRGTFQHTSGREALEIYRWWKYERPANWQRAEDMLHRLYANTRLKTRPVELSGETMHQFIGLEHVGENLTQPGDSNEALRALEQENEDDDQRMLHRLIDIRRSLWT